MIHVAAATQEEMMKESVRIHSFVREHRLSLESNPNEDYSAKKCRLNVKNFFFSHEDVDKQII